MTIAQFIENQNDVDVLKSIQKATSRKIYALQSKDRDKVRFNSLISPRYLTGREAIVVKRNPKSIVVNCPNEPGYGRFAGKENIRCPKSVLEEVA